MGSSSEAAVCRWRVCVSRDSIREDEKQTDCIIPESLLIEELKQPYVIKEVQAVPGPVRLGSRSLEVHEFPH